MAPVRHLASTALITAALAATDASAAPPNGFTLESWPGDWGELLGIVPTGDGRFIAWEQAGRAWMVGPDGMASTTPLLDLREEVGFWREHGLLGLAVDPEFLDNGLLYVLYVVDRHHLLYFGTSEYDPNADAYFNATIGRVTRFTVDPDLAVLDPTSRDVLLGESIDTGLPILHDSHATGSLVFGEDGTLLISMGDSGSFSTIDLGDDTPKGWVSTALADGIIDASENVGAFRSQSLDSLAGKILRIDPDTGDGVASNPWYEADSPRSSRSRIWSLGLRNPYRMCLVPGTGHPDPAVGDPGTIAYGDVGWGSREEIGFIEAGGENLGWPLYEGLEPNPAYWKSDKLNFSLQNPLGDTDCPAFFMYRDLVSEPSTGLSTSWNPCDPAWLDPADWSGPSVLRDWAGFQGEDYLDFGGDVGEWIDFIYTTSAPVTEQFGLRYANGSGAARPVEVLVGKTVVATLACEPTGGWSQWRIDPFETTLAPGTHRIRLRTLGPSGPNVDYLETRFKPATRISPGNSFVHAPPFLDYQHGSPGTRFAAFDAGGRGITVSLGEDAAPVGGVPVGGNCFGSIAVVEDPRWPEEWRGVVFGDYIFQWLAVLKTDGSGTPTELAMFDQTAGAIVCSAFDPASGGLVAVRYGQNPIRIIPPTPPCPADLDGDGFVSGGDIGLLLAGWGTSGPGDLDQNGTIGGGDLGFILAAWGPCGP